LLKYENHEARVDFESRSLGAEKGFPTSFTSAGGVVQANMGDKHRPGSPSLAVEADEALEFSAGRLVLAALDATDLRALPNATLHDESYHVVGFNHGGLPVRLYLNAYTGLPGVVEWTRSYPEDIYWRGWGDVHNFQEFTNYSLLPGGIRLPSQTDLFRNGQLSHSQVVLKFELNPQLPGESFAIAPDVKSAFEQRKSIMAEGPPLGKPSPLVEGNESMVQFVGAWNCAVIKQPDGLVIIEAPIGPAHTKSLLAEAKKRFPGTPIKAVVTTSDSWPHYAGVREMVAAGIPIYATDLNRPILTRHIKAPYKITPDSLAKSPKPPIFHWVSQKTVLGSGPNRLVVYPMRNASGERMLMVYFPEHKLLYTSDLLQPGQEGPFFFMEYVREAADAAQRENLAVDRFFGMHMPLTPWSTVVKALADNESAGNAKP
jgi:glyoxylase-like metal-dependent hydrolase (beta-lactamase superfamily II)